ncbi:MAG: hypothetical protein GWP91_15345 [Rhodobacterales bacterium]|nr:hypothetical protein [Rhodobacterales bacterium]
MRIQTSIDIHASVDSVWGVLSDFSQYESWNPLTTRVEGILDIGETVTLRVMLSGRKMYRKHVISRVIKGKELGWTIRSQRNWWVHGERVQRIEDLGNGVVRYTNDEQVHGVLGVVTGLVYRRVLEGALEDVGRALKVRVESTV